MVVLAILRYTLVYLMEALYDTRVDAVGHRPVSVKGSKPGVHASISGAAREAHDYPRGLECRGAVRGFWTESGP